MASRIHEFKVTVEVERVTGKFASNEEIRQMLRDEIEMGNPGHISGLGADGESEYTVNDFTVEDL